MTKLVSTMTDYWSDMDRVAGVECRALDVNIVMRTYVRLKLGGGRRCYVYMEGRIDERLNGKGEGEAKATGRLVGRVANWAYPATQPSTDNAIIGICR